MKKKIENEKNPKAKQKVFFASLLDDRGFILLLSL